MGRWFGKGKAGVGEKNRGVVGKREGDEGEGDEEGERVIMGRSCG